MKKKLHKIGTTILLSLAPAALIGMVTGVVIANWPKGEAQPIVDPSMSDKVTIEVTTDGRGYTECKLTAKDETKQVASVVVTKGGVTLQTGEYEWNKEGQYVSISPEVMEQYPGQVVITPTLEDKEPTGEITITLSVDASKGSCNKETITFEGSKKFGDAMYGVVVTPNSDDDYFEGWEDGSGNLITDDTVIKSSFTAKARISTRVQPTTIDYVKYTPIYENGTLTSYSASWNDEAAAPTELLDIVIKNEINEKPVTEIGEGDAATVSGGFMLNQHIKTVTIPSNIKKIGSYSFGYCMVLQKVTFESNSQLTTIGEQTFYGCRALADINLPSTLTLIGDEAFYGVNEALINEDENCWYLKQDQNGTNDHFACVSWDEWYSKETLPTSIHKDCKIISGIKFDNSVEEITIPDGVISICNDGIIAENIKKINFATNSKLQYIDANAFSDCPHLAEIEIPSNAELLGNPFTGVNFSEFAVTFAEGSKYKTKDVDGNVLIYTELEDGNIEIVAFISKDSGATSYDIPTDVEKIDSYAFYYSDLTSVNFVPNNKLISVGEYAFAHSKLKNIDFTNWNNITIIPAGCFYICSELLNIIFPEENCSIKKIDVNAFDSAGVADTGITLTIPNSIDKIATYAFSTTENFIKNIKFQNPKGSETGSSWKLAALDTDTYSIKTETKLPTNLSDPAKNMVYLCYDEEDATGGRANWGWVRIIE